MLGLGIDPSKFKDTSDMARVALPKIQAYLKQFKGNEGAMLPMAQAMGFGGMSQDDLIRLFSGKPEDVKSLMDLSKAKTPGLDVPEGQVKSYDDLVTATDLAGGALKTLGEDILSVQVPRWKGLADVIGGSAETMKTQGWLRQTPIDIWDLPNRPTFTGAAPPGYLPGGLGAKLTGPGRVPTGTLHSPLNNPPLESSIYGGAAVGESDSPGVMGGFTRVGIFTPKIEKLNKQVVDTTKSLEAFNQKLMESSRSGSGAYLVSREQRMNGPITIGPSGTPISAGDAPTYWSGGMGAAGQPRSVTRGAARGTDAGDISGTAVTQPGEAGKYRPVYKLGDKDLSDAVVNTIAGEAKSGNTAGVDAVIDNMMNRLGTKTYGPSGNLEEVARARGQYSGYRKAGSEEAAKIRERIKAIASGALPDITGGSNEYRASWYNGPWRQKIIPEGINIGGNIFARNPKGGTSPYAAYGDEKINAAADVGVKEIGCG